MEELKTTYRQEDFTQRTRSFFASSVSRFLQVPTEEIVGQLATRIGLEHRGDEAQQIRAWHQQIEILKAACRSIGQPAKQWGILLELPLLRLGRRIDTVILTGDRVLCLELKIGADRYTSADINQALDYALCLRDFHGASHGREIIPILCASEAPAEGLPATLDILDDVGTCLRVNADTLAAAIKMAASPYAAEAP